MIITLISILAIMYTAVRLDEKFNIPIPLSLVAIATGVHILFPDVLSIVSSPEDFATVVLFLLPILLLTDTLEIDIHELRKNALSLFYLACVSVVLSILSGLVVANSVFAEYNLSVAAVVLLFSMVLATDPVSVVSIFSKFELPHRLKILAEGESLFNDATALIAFVFIGLYMLEGNELTMLYTIEISAAVLFGTVVLGTIVGLAGVFLIQTTKNQTAEMIGVVITAYTSFYLAEHFHSVLHVFGFESHFHLSGILALIVSALIINYFFTVDEDKEKDSDISDDAKEKISKETNPVIINSIIHRLSFCKDTRERHETSRNNIQVFALMANTVLFIAMGEIVDFSLLLKYWQEILAMFAVTTVIRAAMMVKYSLLSNHVNSMNNMNIRWWSVLTFAGIKGGLSIVMLTMIPSTFEHIEMFKAVVIGVILLSTFVYATALILIISKNKAEFKLEKLREEH